VKHLQCYENFEDPEYDLATEIGFFNDWKKTEIIRFVDFLSQHTDQFILEGFTGPTTLRLRYKKSDLYFSFTYALNRPDILVQIKLGGAGKSKVFNDISSQRLKEILNSLIDKEAEIHPEFYSTIPAPFLTPELQRKYAGYGTDFDFLS
jgi:hypothetical protein